MTHNPENIPSEVFDWVENFPFQELNQVQRNLVLQHFTQEEYDEMHLVTSGIRELRISDSNKSRTEIKVDLLQRFDALHKQPEQGMVIPVVFWRAAAVFLLAVCGILTYITFRKINGMEQTVVTLRDTLFVAKNNPAPSKTIYDTVFVTVPGNKVPVHTYHRTRPTAPAAGNSNFNSSDLSVLSIRDLKRTPNQTRKNSLKDDTLRRKFGFVSL